MTQLTLMYFYILNKSINATVNIFIFVCSILLCISYTKNGWVSLLKIGYQQMCHKSLLNIQNNVYSKCSHTVWTDMCIKLSILASHIEDNLCI